MAVSNVANFGTMLPRKRIHDRHRREYDSTAFRLLPSLFTLALLETDMKLTVATALVVSAAALLAAPAHAQRVPYGDPISLDHAQKIAQAAENEAKRLTQPLGVTIAIHDSGCNLVLLHRMDNTNLGTTNVAQDKSYAACAFRTNTKAAQDRMTAGGPGLIFLQLRGMTAVEGGMPIIVNGKQIGSIGISGGSSEQDNQIATAAVAAAGHGHGR
jgi:glc operon protein GlcG